GCAHTAAHTPTAGVGPRPPNRDRRNTHPGAAMLFVYIVSAAIVIGTVSYIIHLFLRDHMIDTHGREIRALVEDVRRVAEYDGGSITIEYRLSWHEDGETKYVEGRETILARRSSQVQKGCEVDIKYLDDDHISFVFDK
ncbi:hypothetical protein, partial [Streptomyces sp. NPDC056921]|uniref:hypothetical protein n=2 Tax=unclassified Streptomyces TaxID=2593676 RepID=UPI00362EB621